MIYIIIGLFVEAVTECFFLFKGTSLIFLMNEVLEEKQHKELKETYSLKQLHFIFAGLIIFFWPVYLFLLVVKP